MRYLLTILFCISSLICFSQAPRQLNAYTPQTQVNFLGTIANDSGLVFRHNFPDTATANLGWIKNIPFVLTIVNDTLRMRNSSADAWITVGSGSGGGGSGINIYNRDSSLAGNRIMSLNGFDFYIRQDSANTWNFDPNDQSIFTTFTNGSNSVQENITTNGGTPLWYAAANVGLTNAVVSVAFDGDINKVFADFSVTNGVDTTSSIKVTVPQITYTSSTHTFNGNVLLGDLVGGGTTGAIIDNTGKISRGTATTLIPTTINTTDSVASGGNIRTRVEGYLEIANGATNGSIYTAFPIPVTKKDTIFYFYKASATHAGEGRLMVSRSVDGNHTIDSTWQLNIDGSADSCLNLSAGASGTGRLLVQWRSSKGGGLNILTGYSDDGARTWTQTTTYASNTTPDPFGRIQSTSSDTILANYYTIGASDTAYWLGSADNGATWSFYDTAAVGSNNYNETDFVYLGNRRIITVSRTENLNRPSQFYSTDNGHTQIRAGGLNSILFDSQLSPLYIIKWNNYLWLVGCTRDGDFSNWFYSSGLESQVFTDTSKWSSISEYYHPLSDDGGALVDEGYNTPFIFAGKLITAGYDVSPLQSNTSSRTTRIFTVPIVANGDFVKAYNNSNQSISDATATLVQFIKVDLNDNLIYNTDSNCVIINRDGWYQIKANVTFDTSASGTYRQMYVYLSSADWDAAITTKQPQIISQSTISGNTSNFDFNRIEVNTPYYLRANEKIKIYVKQDSGGSLNIVNTDRNRMATLNIKRLNE